MIVIIINGDHGHVKRYLYDGRFLTKVESAGEVPRVVMDSKDFERLQAELASCGDLSVVTDQLELIGSSLDAIKEVIDAKQFLG